MGRTPHVPHELQDRVFTLEEARALGVTSSALRGKSYERVGARLYRCKQASDDTWALLSALRRTLPASAVFVGRTAAWGNGLDVDPKNPVQVATNDAHSRLGLEVRHVATAGEVVEINGVPFTSLGRTLFDLSRWSTAVEALVSIDMALFLHLITKDELRDYKRADTSRLTSLIEVAAPAESPMETRLRWLLITAGLPMPEVQVDLYDRDDRFIARADLYYPQARLIIEFDGRNHQDRLVGDLRRQNALHNAGYKILRFSSADVYGRPDQIVALVRAALRG